MRDSRWFKGLKILLMKKFMLLKLRNAPPEWRFFYFPPTAEAGFSNDPTVFRHTWRRNAADACLHRLDREHQTFLSELKTVVEYFGSVCGEKKGVYRIVVRS
jgi:hypothetical protein